ncbi:MAG: hypothetical protein IPL40_14500 [Proteobacteria bacterium]|nr:hypothetical protein [Pseudomonadota bacterium]
MSEHRWSTAPAGPEARASSEVSHRVERAWSGGPAGVAIDFTLARVDGALCLRVAAPLSGVPAPRAPAGRLWRLWEHEVFELFIAGPEEQYLELELGPHGHYLALRLASVRVIVDAEVPLAHHRAWIDGDRWYAEAALPWAELPPAPHRFNAYAIVGHPLRQHLALFPLEGSEPDFHRLESYRALAL